MLYPKDEEEEEEEEENDDDEVCGWATTVRRRNTTDIRVRIDFSPGNKCVAAALRITTSVNNNSYYKLGNIPGQTSKISSSSSTFEIVKTQSLRSVSPASAPVESVD